jgi:hypothetical protein
MNHSRKEKNLKLGIIIAYGQKQLQKQLQNKLHFLKAMKD